MNGSDTSNAKVVCDIMKCPVAPLFPAPDGRAASSVPPFEFTLAESPLATRGTRRPCTNLT